MRIIVSDYAASPESGGTFSILEDFYNDVLKNDSENEWFFILSGKYFPTSDNVKIIVRNDLKQSKVKKLFFELGSGRKFINQYHPDAFISLQNISTVGVDSPVKIVYLHQSLPFFQEHRFSFFKTKERSVAFYQRLVGKIIKYSISKEQPTTIVQTKWMKRALEEQTKLSGEKIVTVSPKIPKVDDGHYFDNQSHSFFYPATPYVYKNHQVILDAVKLLEEQGSNNFNVDFTLTREQLTIDSDNVKLLGYLPRKEVLKMYEDHILIFPSYIESYGLPMLEAAQKADIILAADIEIAHEVLSGYSNVYYFSYQDPVALARLMEKVIDGRIRSDSQPIRLHYRNESVLQTVQKIINKTGSKQ
ncbi:glycosyltransferase [Lactobacillaceae bacterium 24-114]